MVIEVVSPVQDGIVVDEHLAAVAFGGGGIGIAGVIEFDWHGSLFEEGSG